MIVGPLAILCLAACESATVDQTGPVTPPAEASYSAGPHVNDETWPRGQSAPASVTLPAPGQDVATPVPIPTSSVSAAPAKAPPRVGARTSGTMTVGRPSSTAPSVPPVDPTTMRPSVTGTLTLSCTWDGTRVSALAQWSGYPGIVITVSAPGVPASSSGVPVIGHRVNGLAGQHGLCTASGAGQSKSGSA